ncbi:MAG: pyridoxal phosphate-dependent decarboxylase family protein [Egibacteraceae bacterium]
MRHPEWRTVLTEAAERAIAFLESLEDRPVAAPATLAELRHALGVGLPEHPEPADKVVAELASAADRGTVGTQSGRYFGFVIGGAMPAALGADWLAAAWDQNAGLYVGGPAAAVAEEVAAAWLLDLLGLPRGVSTGFVTGGQMANTTALAIARHHVLAAAGWNVERDGLAGAPPVRVLAGRQRHASIDRGLRYLGLGTAALEPVATDDQGRMQPDALAAALGGQPGPAIVCAQLGEVNTGGLDPVGAVCDVAQPHGAWVHVDGAFGLWARATPRLRSDTDGAERADSWACDAHKWLNVPYDCGLVFSAHPESHRAAMGTQASYLIRDEGGRREQMDWNPEFSRRARGFPVYAALRSLGRSGVVDLVDGCCVMARRFAEQLGAADGATVLNDVVLNQVLVRFDGDDDRNRQILAAIQQEGTCWMSGTTWRGRVAMRISVSNWSTTAADVDASVAAILRCAAAQPLWSLSR